MLSRVLIVDDEPDVAQALRRVVEHCGRFDVRVQTRPLEVPGDLAGWKPELVFTDLVMPDLDGMAVLELSRRATHDITVVVVSAYSSIENAVRAVKAGAFDFLAKPFDPDAVELIIAKAMRERGQLDRAAELSRQVARVDPWLAAILGEDPAVQRLREWILKVRDVPTSVLIQGETGTGKELVARAVHGGRGPFVAINVAAIPDDLAETELFGHRSGSFTGATAERRGLLLEAQGGTLFLDEVNAMSLPLQAKLLRVIQDKTVRPVGSNREVAVDFRLVCATNEELEHLVAEGRFRRDLYHRIGVLTTRLPPLRERRGDIPLLAAEFLRKYASAHGRNVRRLSSALVEALARREWPGNIRELENEVEQLVVMAPQAATEITQGVAAAPTVPPSPAGAAAAGEERLTLAEVEQRYIQEVLAEVRGNKSRAARILGIDYKTLLRKVSTER